MNNHIDNCPNCGATLTHATIDDTISAAADDLGVDTAPSESFECPRCDATLVARAVYYYTVTVLDADNKDDTL